MTRENKLALVVGFGLILFVGILISDHFSVVRSQHAADLTTKPIDDPLLVNVQSHLIDLSDEPKQKPQEPIQGSPSGEIIQGGNSTNTDVIPLNGGGGAPETNIAQGQQTPESVPGFVPHEEPAATSVQEFVFHDVKKGETMCAISRQHFGDISKVQDIADYNNLNDSASLRVGQRLRIPTGSNHTGTDAAATTSGETVQVTYTVKDGDSLSEIAQRFLGSKGKWKKLFDMNKDVLDDPDNVKVGTILRIS